ncbi:MAG: hypothetical protein M3Y51_02460 [Actinomycetota bacterium]|nr:hypothetical protein [Actinomycetota bacterium]
MQHELMIPRACDVIEVAVEEAGDDGDCTLIIRSVGRRGEQVRRIGGPRATVQHAATAVARHYGLTRDGHRRWLAPVPTASAEPLAG